MNCVKTGELCPPQSFYNILPSLVGDGEEKAKLFPVIHRHLAILEHIEFFVIVLVFCHFDYSMKKIV
jgi:hypothetical protein